MVDPVPGYPDIGSPYGVSGSWWTTCGWHSGADIPAPRGATVVAMRPGHLTHVNYGSAFGGNQVAVRCSDGTEDFYAHMQWRAPQGEVAAGEKIGEVDNQGSSSGDHLHVERHAGYGWSCSLMRDPQPSIDYQSEEDDMPLSQEDIARIWAYPVKDPMQDGKKIDASVMLSNIRGQQGKIIDAVNGVAAKVWGWLIKDQLDNGVKKAADTILMNIRAKQGDR